MYKEQRELVLKREFKHNHPSPFSFQISLNRFYTFILEHTDIVFISFIKKDTIIAYLLYHQLKKFSIITFTQVIKDIKNMILFLKNYKFCDINVGLSPLNHNLSKKINK